MTMRLRFLSLPGLILASAFLSGAPLRAEEIRHSFFVAGPNFTGIIDEDGQRGLGFGQARRARRLGPTLGNVLIAWSDE